MSPILAVTQGTAIWYLSRGSGVVALLLLTASVAVGILAAKNWQAPGQPRFVTGALHRNLSVLAVVFVGIHIATVVVDGYAPIGWLDSIIPFLSPYRPIWLGLGTLATDLLLAVLISSALRKRIGYRTWQAIHLASYLCWPVAVLHGLGTGSDTVEVWLLALTAACVAAFCGAAFWRLTGVLGGHKRARVGLAGATLAIPMALGWFTLLGPMRPNWARRAGTPATARTVTEQTAQPGASPATSGTPVQGSPQPFAGELTGTLNEDVSGTVVIEGTVRPAPGGPATLRIVLRGRADQDDGGIELRSGTITLATPGGQLNGPVTGLDGNSITGTINPASGASDSILVKLDVGEEGAVSGRVTVAPAAGR